MEKVLCVGSLIIDIINDAIDRPLDAGEGVETAIGVHLGGNAFNVAVDLRNLGLEGEVGCVGAVGDDFLGSQFYHDLERRDVIPRLRTMPGVGTSKNIILQIMGDERRYHLDPGPNASLGTDYVLEQLAAFEPTILYIGEVGFLGEINQHLAKILRAAKDQGCLTVVDTVITPGEDWEQLHDAAEMIDVFHCNDHEARSITGEVEADRAVVKLLEMGIALPVVSQGEHELLLGYQEMLFTVPAFSVDSVDPTGAGDAFTAGVIHRLTGFAGSTLAEKLGTDDDKLLEAVLYGEAAGAACVTALGCTPAVNAERVTQLMKARSANLRARIAKQAI